MFDILKGLTVIEGSAFVAAPLAGLTLSQLGANVIRFDMIGGGIDYHRMPLSKETGTSLYWSGLNKGKKSIAINLKDPRGRKLVQDLITAPDKEGLLLTNFSGVSWLDYALLKKRRKDLIKIELQGNHDGTNAVDYTVNCALGYPSVTGHGGMENPVNHVLPAWDIAAGYQVALGLLAALNNRHRTGQGAHVKLALSDVGYSVVSHLGHIAEAQINKEQRKPIGNNLYGAFGRNFKTADNRQFMVAAISEKQWLSLCQATGTTDAMTQLEEQLGLNFLIQDQRYAATEKIAGLIEQWASGKTLAAVKALFDQHGVCWGVYRTFVEMASEDPYVSEDNPMFDTIEQPGVGQYLAAGSALNFQGFQRGTVRPAPMLGQHTDEVLSDLLGLSGSEIGKLHDQGIVAGFESIN